MKSPINKLQTCDKRLLIDEFFLSKFQIFKSINCFQLTINSMIAISFIKLCYKSQFLYLHQRPSFLTKFLTIRALSQQIRKLQLWTNLGVYWTQALHLKDKKPETGGGSSDSSVSPRNFMAWWWIHHNARRTYRVSGAFPSICLHQCAAGFLQRLLINLFSRAS